MPRLYDWLQATWYGERGGGWLRPCGVVFGLVSRWRRRAYQRGWLPAWRSSRTVVVVGNLTVGGTGKTPAVLWLAAELQARGWRVGIVTRGYRGTLRTAHRVTARHTAAESGDEAVLLWRRLQVPVAVGRDRCAAVRLLEADCDLIISDDGLQHFALWRDFEIALVDGSRGLGNGRCLPAGPLREPAGRLHEVDAVIVHGGDFAWPAALHMTLVPQAFVALADGQRRPPAAFAGRRALAVAAIGHPARFFRMLRQLGLEPREVPLPDHASITAATLRREPGLPLLMTEKDAVKCAAAARADAWYLEVAAEFSGEVAGLLARIEDAARRRAAGG
ncbi:MAG: tetraacyldisaccharide 4'-kinase [Gammaproteobacteria bacterium]|nr:tetraacyldisaccharide 4'-kinase [Gammaproteobacteria bacterium]